MMTEPLGANSPEDVAMINNLGGGGERVDRPIDRTQIATSVVTGSAALLLRQAVTFAFTLAGSILLARVLTPAEFGGYAMILFVAALSRLLVDGGLAATLVQQTEEPTEIERSTVFTVQTIISLFIFILLQFVIPLLSSLFAELQDFDTAIRWASVSLLVAPVLSICFALLERRLQFGRVGFLLSIQPIVFNVLAVLLATMGWGIVGLALSLTVSTILVVPFAVLNVHYLPKYSIRWGPLHGRFRFGLPFIGTNMISTLKDSVNPLFIGIMFGPVVVGYINWAQQIAVVGVYVLSVLGRLLFPLFARLRTDPRALSEAVFNAVFWCNVVVAPIAVFTFINAHDITDIIFGPKWVPAIPTLLLLSVSNLISPSMVVLVALMNALGKATLPFVCSILWFVGTWIFVPLFSRSLGFVGYGWANFAVGLFGIPLILASREYLPLRRYFETFTPWPLAIVGIGMVACIQKALIHQPNIGVVLTSGLAGLIVSAGLLMIVSRNYVLDMWKVVKNVRT
jgi:O-antigen/teichoic acid export membrane protein